MKHQTKTIIGAVAGDVIGSYYEGKNFKTAYFPLFTSQSTFTDDTVLTMAVADAILNQRDFKEAILTYGRKYPNRGYGGLFRSWLKEKDPQPYNSFGNGSAMRVSSVGFAYDSLDTVLEVAEQSAVVSHNHEEGIKGAKAIAVAIFLSRKGQTKSEIKTHIETTFGYDLDKSLDTMRPFYRFDATCQGTVPQAIRAFLESSDYENAIRLAISIGGDSDTIACMAGGIAAAYYKEIPEAIITGVVARLPVEFIGLLNQFEEKFN
jgi:ADP-ribosylglycohydrolase